MVEYGCLQTRSDIKTTRGVPSSDDLVVYFFIKAQEKEGIMISSSYDFKPQRQHSTMQYTVGIYILANPCLSCNIFPLDTQKAQNKDIVHNLILI